eukprot:scaffold80923_cov18-Tisochrysis_lutea.AAC.1
MTHKAESGVASVLPSQRRRESSADTPRNHMTHTAEDGVAPTEIKRTADSLCGHHLPDDQNLE